MARVKVLRKVRNIKRFFSAQGLELVKWDCPCPVVGCSGMVMGGDNPRVPGVCSVCGCSFTVRWLLSPFGGAYDSGK